MIVYSLAWIIWSVHLSFLLQWSLWLLLRWRWWWWWWWWW